MPTEEKMDRFLVIFFVFLAVFHFCFAPYSKYGSKIVLPNALLLTFFNPMFANYVHASLFTLVNVKLLFDQNVANLPQNATGIVRILEMFKIWVFSKKKYGFFEKKLEFFFKSIKVASLR